MKQFFKKLSFFIIVVMAGWLCLEIFYRTVPNNYTEKNKNIKLMYKDCQTLIFGNSHAFHGLNPAYFSEKTFNISNVSQTILYDKLLFEKHADSLQNLKCIILPVEYSSLSQSDSYPELQWRKYFYAKQMGLNTGTITNYDIKKYSLALVPRFSLSIESVKEYFNNKTLVQCGVNGWAPLLNTNKEFNNARMGKIIAAKHEDGSVNFKANISRLKVIIAKCEKKGIKVVLITMPVTSFYASNVNSNKLSLIISKCNALAQHSKDVYYLNLFQDSRFKNSDFYDTDHLNTMGAKKCSKIVNDFIASTK